eukprot:6485247-Amphidinium_carterae.1
MAVQVLAVYRESLVGDLLADLYLMQTKRVELLHGEPIEHPVHDVLADCVELLANVPCRAHRERSRRCCSLCPEDHGQVIVQVFHVKPCLGIDEQRPLLSRSPVAPRRCCTHLAPVLHIVVGPQSDTATPPHTPLTHGSNLMGGMKSIDVRKDLLRGAESVPA